MVKSSITTSPSRIRQRIGALAAIAAIGTTFAAATPAANAQPKGGSGEAKGCEVYNENTGKTELVPVGSKVGLFTCGSDGEWHFGWLITGLRPPHGSGSHPVLQIRNRSAVRLAASRG